MKPKIIFAVTNDLSYDQRMIRICSSLANNGFEVLLIGRKKEISIPLIHQKFEQKRFNLWFEKGKLFYLEYNLRLLFFLFIHRFDIIGSVDLDTLLPCFIASKLKAKPCVFDAHEYYTEVPEVVNRRITKWIWNLVGDFVISQLKYAYTVSASLQELFTEKYGISFGLIRNLPNNKVFAIRSESVVYNEKTGKSRAASTLSAGSSTSTEPSILLYQGVLNESRGLEEIIAAMTELKNVELWLAGEGDLSDKLRKLVTQVQLESKVKFLGYLPPEELRQVTPKATIGLNLIENKGLSYYYSLANKTFDYIQAELPAIHSDFPEYQKINEEFEIGILVDNLEKETLVKAVNLLLNDTNFYNQLKHNCIAAKSVYNWEKEEIELLKIYKSIPKQTT